MKVWKDINLSEFTPWAGAVDTYRYILDRGQIDTMEAILDELYPKGLGETELNDILWFEAEWIYEHLGLPDPYAE